MTAGALVLSIVAAVLLGIAGLVALALVLTDWIERRE